MINNFNLVAEFPKCEGVLYNLPPIQPREMPLFLWFRDTVLSICLCRKVAIVFGVITLSALSPDYAKFSRLLWLVTLAMTIWTMWKNKGGPERVRKDVLASYPMETSSAQEQGVIALPPVYCEKVGEEAV
jgi:hypothetical protein